MQKMDILIADEDCEAAFQRIFQERDMAEHKQGYVEPLLTICPGCLKTGEHWPNCFNKGTSQVIRQFETGANRDTEEGKLDVEAFNSPLVDKRYAEYMHTKRHLRNGTLRDGDNWQKGIPLSAYIKSLARHMLDLRLHFRNLGDLAHETLEDTLCAIIFNAKGYLFEVLKAKRNDNSRIPPQV